MAKKAFLCMWLAAFLLLCGYKVHAAAPPSLHIVTGVDVLYRQSDTTATYRFTQPAKMEAMLNYLRLLKYAGMPNDDPELHEGSTYRITVQLVGGGSRVYYLHANRYLSRDYRPWEQVKPSHSLFFLLQSLQQDK